MAIPAGISTALVHLDAPVSFIGDPGQLHVTIKSSVPLVWAATGTPLANFIDNINPGEGTELSVELPHTDQDGFLDGNGNTFKGWSYIVEITYEKSGEQVHFPTREFQILVGQDSVDLALVPAGESYVPVVAPILPVTSLEGFTGAVTLAQLQLERVDNTNDLEKPISTATQAALNTLTANANSRILQPADPNADRILFWDDSANAYVPLVHAAPLNITGTTLSISAATNAAAGTMSAADKAKLDAATTAPTAATLMYRDGGGGSQANNLYLYNAPTTAGHATRKDYVDAAVAGVTYGSLGVVPTSSLPPLAINETFPVASQAAMLALVAQRGDMAIRSDINRTFVLATDSPGTLADWKEISAAGQVVSVAGKTGTVVLVKADVGLDQVDNTSDAAKPISTAQQTALNLKAPLANPTFTGTVSGVTKTHVGLGNVDNTSDANKPVSTAQAAAFVPRWKAATAYAVGDPVITPRNTVVKSKSARTSGASYDATEAANWTGQDNVMVFSNGGFSWGANSAWDAGTLAVDTSPGASSQAGTGPAFATAGSLSGTLKFLETGIYDAVWMNAPNGEPGNAGYRINMSGAWPNSPDAPNSILGQGIHINGQTYWETAIMASGFRVPQVGLEIRFTGIQINATNNVPRIRLIKRGEI